MMKMIEEIWRDVVGYEDYLQVSNFGNFRRKFRDGSRNKTMKNKVLQKNPKTSKIQVTINRNHIFLHIAECVADAFIPLPSGSERTQLTAITTGEKYNFVVDNIIWVKKTKVNPRTNTLYSEMKMKKKITIPEEIVIKKDENAIIQLRENGEFVRRYIDINEVLEVHPLWDFAEILMCLTGHFPDAYGWRWKYEYIYEKK